MKHHNSLRVDVCSLATHNNSIEPLNSAIRKSVRKRKLFPSDTAALKAVYISEMELSKRWKRPVKTWKNAFNQFATQYAGNRIWNREMAIKQLTVQIRETYYLAEFIDLNP